MTQDMILFSTAIVATLGIGGAAMMLIAVFHWRCRVLGHAPDATSIASDPARHPLPIARCRRCGVRLVAASEYAVRHGERGAWIAAPDLDL